MSTPSTPCAASFRETPSSPPSTPRSRTCLPASTPDRGSCPLSGQTTGLPKSCSSCKSCQKTTWAVTSLNADGDPDLGFDGVGRCAVKGFDSQMLLDPAEEECEDRFPGIHRQPPPSIVGKKVQARMRNVNSNRKKWKLLICFPISTYYMVVS